MYLPVNIFLFPSGFLLIDAPVGIGMSTTRNASGPHWGTRASSP